MKKHRSTQFYQTLRVNFAKVFDAKKVPLTIISDIFEPSFLELQKNGFEELKKTISAENHPLESFDYYVEQLRFLTGQLSSTEL